MVPLFIVGRGEHVCPSLGLSSEKAARERGNNGDPLSNTLAVLLGGAKRVRGTPGGAAATREAGLLSQSHWSDLAVHSRIKIEFLFLSWHVPEARAI